MPNETDMTRFIAALGRIRARETEELQKLCSQPDLFTVAQALTDNLYSQILHLANYEKLIDGNGKEVPIIELIGEMQAHLAMWFKSLTGREYLPDSVRSMECTRKK